MASTRDYLEFILEQLGGLEDISFRAMMGEYVLYYKGRIFGGIYDNRFLVKPVRTARSLMPDAAAELPYNGAKEMLLVERVDDKLFLEKLLNEMFGELSMSKPLRKSSQDDG